MIMPSYTTLPESMLSSYGSTSLAGLASLGCGCSQMSDDGTGNLVCQDPDPCVPVFTPPVFNPSDCAYGGVYPNCNPAPTVGSPITTITIPSTTSGGLTAQQLALDNAIVQGGSSIAKIIAAGATGTSVLPNGAVISPGAYVPTAIGATATSGFGMMALLAVAAVVLLMGRGR